ncbi:DUF1456 family protein [Prolixibacteraceae bacterium Z1-6]|uniref:DUF1456 family protein n=1 Tax=Draconibacterium aestuarii TaxID=2998507 RepID=A0A9X3F2K3_9BACT|nr:DUF1456 family protein [Prolixibacteraceae bacterium Z1-6]
MPDSTYKLGVLLNCRQKQRMNNNDILRRIRYAFNIADTKMIETFALGEVKTNRAQVSSWLKKDIDPDYIALPDFQLAAFLNGLITDKRGSREGPKPIPENILNNNIILRKLRIALNLNDTDVLQILDLAGLKISKHELSAFFRKPGQSQYRECKDQVLRNYLKGLQMKYRENKMK